MPLRVDVATGATTLYEEDLRLPGYLPLVLARAYHSTETAVGPFGAGWRFGFDVSLRLDTDRITYRDADGRKVVFKAVAVGQQVTHVETGLVLQHHPDAYVVQRSPLLHHLFLTKNALGASLRLDRIEHRSGHRIQCLYKGAHFIGLIDSMERQVHCTYANDRLSELWVAPSPDEEKVRVQAYRYGIGGDLLAVADAAGRETRYRYDGPCLVAYTDRMGSTWYARYDPDMRCTAVWNTETGQVRHLDYDALRQTTRVVDEAGRQAVYQHVGGELILARHDPDGSTQNYYYDARRQLVGYSDNDGHILVFQPSDREAGKRVMLEGPQRLATFTVDENGLATTASDGRHTYTLIYDDKGLLAGLTTPCEAHWGFERDRAGRVARITSPEGRFVRLTYGRLGRRLTVEDALGLRYVAQYDGFGRLTERTDASDRREQFSYDKEGRLEAVKVGVAYEVRYAYDAGGRLTGVADSWQHNLRLRYDAAGRLTSREAWRGGAWTYQYDRAGRLEAVRNQDREARFAYDERGRLTRLVAPDGTTTAFRYEADGVVLANVAAGETRRTLTSLREMARTVLPDGTEQVLTYNTAGALIGLERGDETIAFRYDDEGRPSGVSHGDRDVTLAYDRDGCLGRVEDALGHRLRLTHDRRGRVEAVHVGEETACRFAYDAADRVTALHLGGSRRVTFAYDALGRVQTRELTGEGDRPDVFRFQGRDTPLQDRLLPLPVVPPEVPPADVEEPVQEDRERTDEQRQMDELLDGVRARLAEAASGDGGPPEEVAAPAAGISVQQLLTQVSDRLRRVTSDDPEAVAQAATFDLDALLAEVDEAAEPGSGTEPEAPSAIPATNEAEAEDGGLVLFTSGYGSMLVARMNGFDVPLWYHIHDFSRGTTDLPRLTVAVTLHGVDAVLSRWGVPDGEALLRRWTRTLHARIGTDRADVPDARQAGTSWRVLDQFFLSRAFHDTGFPRVGVGALARHQDDPLRAVDPLVMGSHAFGSLASGLWADRAVEAGLDEAEALFQRGGLRPGAVEHLLDH